MAKRRAKLTIETGAIADKRGNCVRWCRLTARNGEIQLSGEVVSKPKRSRAAIVRSMQDVLENEGAVVTWPNKGEAAT